MPNDAGGGPRLLELMRGRPRKSEKLGPILGNSYNVTRALTELRELKGTIGRDLRSGRVMALRPIMLDMIDRTLAVGDWSDSYTTEVQAWLQRFGIPAEWQTVSRAIDAVADRHAFDPVKDYLTSLPWDGKPRINDAPHRYFGARNTPLNRAIGAMFFIQGAARGLDPGCQADGVLFLEGPQDLKKTSAVRALGGPFGSEDLPDFHSKDARMIAGQKWVIEVSENTASRKSDIADAKAFITPQARYISPALGASRHRPTARLGFGWYDQSAIDRLSARPERWSKILAA
jgi:predicted P-loop ATPase